MKLTVFYAHVKDGKYIFNNALSDGTMYMLSVFADRYKVDTTVYIQSDRGAQSTKYCNDNFCVSMVHELPETEYKKADCIFVRGGFRSWIPKLREIKERGIPMVYYGANNPHGHWPFWALLLSDFIDEPTKTRKGVPVYPFIKTVNREIFNYGSKVTPIHYDFMVGSSHIHAKKGQFRALELLEKTFPLSDIVMPGSFIRCRYNKYVLRLCDRLHVTMPGMVDRCRLADYYRSTRLYLYAGTGGQADRGPLEALACGCPVVVKEYSRLPKWFSQSKYVTRISFENERELINAYFKYETIDRRYIAREFENYAGLDKSLDMFNLAIKRVL